MIAIVADHHHVVGDDQVMLAFDGRLDIVADHAAAPAGRGHGPGVGIGQGDLAVRRGLDLALHGLQHRHLGAEPIDLLHQPTGPGHGGLAFLTVSRVESLQIAGDVFGHLLHAFLQLGDGEVLVAGVHRLELRAVDSDQSGAEQTQLAAQHHELAAYSLDRRAVLAAEVGDGL